MQVGMENITANLMAKQTSTKKVIVFYAANVCT